VYHHPQIQRVLANGVKWAAQPGLPQERWAGAGRSQAVPPGSNPHRVGEQTLDPRGAMPRTKKPDFIHGVGG
jgi:trehalose utilization protein